MSLTETYIFKYQVMNANPLTLSKFYYHPMHAVYDNLLNEHLANMNHIFFGYCCYRIISLRQCRTQICWNNIFIHTNWINIKHCKHVSLLYLSEIEEFIKKGLKYNKYSLIRMLTILIPQLLPDALLSRKCVHAYLYFFQSIHTTTV